MDKIAVNFFSKDKIKRLCLGFATSTIMSLCLLALFSFISAKGIIKLSMLGIFSGIAVIIGGFSGGLLNGMLIKEKGIVCGLINGIALAAVILALSIVWSFCFFNLWGIIKLLLIVLSSIIGGIIGVNRKHKEIKY